MSNIKVVLYDVPTKGTNKCFSPNVWKTRLALNYKGIPYETKWLEFPEIEPTLKGVGLEPNSGGPIPYTVPAIKLTRTGEHCMDSRKIVEVIEKRFTPAELHLDSPILARVEGVLPRAFGPLRPQFLPPVSRGILNQESAAFFETARSKAVGMDLQEWGRLNASEQNYIDAEPAWKELAAMLKEDDSGPFFLGKEVSHADFYIVAFLKAMKVIGKEIFDRILVYDPVFKDLYDASADWLHEGPIGGGAAAS